MTAVPYRILVTGSRTWDDTDTICDALDTAVSEVPPHTRDLWLVVGDCPTGADRIAYQWATTAMVPIDAHIADWTTHGKAAGPIRNAAMVRSGADVVLAFIKDGSRGASHTVALARRAGIPVRLWTRP
ncbi:SLOG family protein [Streptomyces sp. NPDC046866]|uniref:SLOG family protein n=1 Tax=Streptomyces sp. NPDC046866 TaxID=3154921 RepID=UPI00345395C3